MKAVTRAHEHAHKAHRARRVAIGLWRAVPAHTLRAALLVAAALLAYERYGAQWERVWARVILGSAVERGYVPSIDRWSVEEAPSTGENVALYGGRTDLPLSDGSGVGDSATEVVARSVAVAQDEQAAQLGDGAKSIKEDGSGYDLAAAIEHAKADHARLLTEAAAGITVSNGDEQQKSNHRSSIDNDTLEERQVKIAKAPEAPHSTNSITASMSTNSMSFVPVSSAQNATGIDRKAGILSRGDEHNLVGGDLFSRAVPQHLQDERDMLVYDGFEQGDFEPAAASPVGQCQDRRWRKEFNLDGMRVVSKSDGYPVRDGNYSLRSYFSARNTAFIRPEPGHDHKYRCELLLSNIRTFTDGAGRTRDQCGSRTCCLDFFPFHKDYSFSFSIFLPQNWKIDMPDDDVRSDDKDTSVMQLHGVPDGRFTVDSSNEIQVNTNPTKFTEDWRSPPVLLSVSNMKTEDGQIVPAWMVRRVQDTRKVSENGLDYTHRRQWTWPAWAENAQSSLGRWTDFTFNIRFSYEDDGRLQVFKNGSMVFNHTGPNCFNDQVAPRIQLGLYKWNWHIPAENDTSHAVDKEVFYDNIRLYRGFRQLS